MLSPSFLWKNESILFGISLKETVGLRVRSKRLTSALSGALSLALSLLLIYSDFEQEEFENVTLGFQGDLTILFCEKY